MRLPVQTNYFFFQMKTGTKVMDGEDLLWFMIFEEKKLNPAIEKG